MNMLGAYLFLLPFFLLSFNLNKTWYSVETTHFVVYYHEGLYDVAKRSVQILETETYPKVTRLLMNPLERKIHVVIADIDDIGNGFAIEIFDQIFILTSDIYYIPLRGRHPWLKDVLTHEFTHIVALRKARKTPHSIPAFYVSAGFFCVITPQNICSLEGLQGKPTLVGGLAFGVVPYSEPAFFTEGIAQLVTEEIGYDALDSYRNMILRTLLYHGKLYPLSKLGNFNHKRGWEGEIVYNHGFSFLAFIRERYGWKTILSVMDGARELTNFSYETLFEKATGKPFDVLEKEWKSWLRQKYSDEIRRYERARREKSWLTSARVIPLKPRRKGFAEYKVYWVSSPLPHKNGLFLIQGRTLMFYHSKDGYDGKIDPDKLIGGVQGYSVSGTQIAVSYSKPTKKFMFFASLPEIYFSLSLGYLVEENKDGKKKLKIKKLKEIARRASSPSFSPDGRKIVYVKTEFDSRNLFIYDIEKKKEERITRFFGGRQFVFPSFSADGKHIVSAYFDGHQQDIVLIDAGKRNISSEEELIFITRDKAEDRDPKFIGESLVMFSSDRDGVFNVYVTDIKTGELWKATEELSSALQPSSDGENLFYVAFEPDGFRVKKMRSSREMWVPIYRREKPLPPYPPPPSPPPLLPPPQPSIYLSSETGYNSNGGGTVRSVATPEQVRRRENSLKKKQKENTPYEKEKKRIWRIPVERVGFLKLSPPLFVPSVGLTATPFLTASPNFFIPLDIIGISLETYSFDRLGRFDLWGRGTLGLLGSWSLSGGASSYHFEYFIPSLFLGVAQIKAIPTTALEENISITYLITQLWGGPSFTFPLIYGRRTSLFVSLGASGIIYNSVARASGLAFIPFSQGYNSMSGRVFTTVSFFRRFSISNIGDLGLGVFGQGIGLSTNWELGQEEEGIGGENLGGTYSTLGGTGGILLSFTTPTSPYTGISFFSYLNGGMFLTDVDIIDEFAGVDPGYFLVFYGDKFLEGGVGMSADIWSGYISIARTLSFHGISLVGLLNAFQFIQQNQNFSFSICSDTGFLCSVSGGIIFYFSVFYRYSFYIYTLFSHGLQDPLDAPVRVYLSIGVGI